MTSLAGYQLETLNADGGLALSRAARTDGSAPSLLVLAPTRTAPPPASMARLEHVFALRDQLDGTFATRPHTLAQHDGRPALLLDDPGGILLSRLVGSPWETETFLRVACGLAFALDKLHAHGLVHKDLRPTNLLVAPPSGQAWLTGFGITSGVPHDRDAPGVLEGTLAYMAPEQTGRMNRSVDARSDLYSLGMTFYEMLTGALPFRAADPMQWIHCHLARTPAPPIERAPHIPAPISAIVVKLLAKNAEDRYQTASGLEADLRRCLGEWETRGRIDAFQLATRDGSERLVVPEKLYGREREVAALLAAFDRVVANGTPELVLVSGPSGVGKSAVVHELHQLLESSRGMFAQGKHDPLERDVPYGAIAQAFRGLVRDILASSDAVVASWRDALRDALGVNAALMVSLIPELELLIGKPPPMPELPPQDAQSRFQLLLRRFVAVFARDQRPLVLFLDDVQWLDTATIDVIEDLVAAAGVRHLLLVGAYRDNEVGPTHPLRRWLDAIRGTARVLDMPLAPLAHGALSALIADAMHAEPLAADALATVVHDRTAGNPFFAIQFLTSLAEDGLLAFSPREGWQWDPERIRATALTENVLDLVAGKLARLPETGRQVLAGLGCLGTAAGSAVLAIACGFSEEELHAALREAVRAGLVLRLHDGYAFAHDRVQEGAYALIADRQRAAEHLRIGRRLVAGLSDDELGEKVFEVGNQLNRGMALIDDEGERRALSALNLRAGMKARGAVAWAAASKHLAQAAALLPADAWTRTYRETFELTLALSECEYVAGNFQRADELFDLLLAQAQSDLDRASVYALRMRLYAVAGKYDEGVTVALRALRLFGVDFPENEADVGPAIARELAEVPVHMGGRAFADLLDAPEATIPEVRAVINLLSDLAPCAYNGRPPLFPLITLRAVNLSLRHGNTDQSSYVYAIYGIMLAGALGDIPAAFDVSELSLRLNEKFGNARLRGTLLHLHGDHVRFWRRPFADGFPILEQAFTACQEVGDLVYASHVGLLTLWQQIENGDNLADVLAASARYATFAQQSHNDASYETIRLEQHFVASLQGQTRDPLAFDDPGGTFDEAASFAAVSGATFGCGIFHYHAMKQIVAFLHGRYADALRHAARAEPILGAAMSMPVEATYHFFHALTVAALLPAAAPAERAGYRELLDGKLAKLATWATHCPENFGHRHVLLAAEVARVDGRTADAMRLYEEAARSAHEHRSVHHEALAHELAARFHAALGATTAAHAHAAAARRAYERWGAFAVVRHIEEAFPSLGEEQAATPRATSAPPAEVDLATVIKVSLALSAELVIDALIERLMIIAVENAGAARGVLILAREGQLRVEAQAVAMEDGVTVRLGSSAITAAELPESILRFVARTGETVILGDASAGSRFAQDAYVAATRPRSILCLPLVKQARLVGVVYLENNLAPHVFTPRRSALLELLASQAAISLENARLHKELMTAQEAVRRSEVFLHEAQRISHTGSFSWVPATGALYWSREILSHLRARPRRAAAGRAGAAAHAPRGSGAGSRPG